MTLLINRVVRAVITQTTLLQWGQWSGICLLLALVMVPLGYRLRFLALDPVQSPRTQFTVATIAWITPALSEEVCFRVLLLPHPTELVSPATTAFWTILSLLLFLLYHPLNALSFFPAGRKIFLNPVFLLLALILGLACSIAYLHTGSLWIPMVIHWLVVVIWLLLLGGYGKLYGEGGISD